FQSDRFPPLPSARIPRHTGRTVIDRLVEVLVFSGSNGVNASRIGISIDGERSNPWRPDLNSALNAVTLIVARPIGTHIVWILCPVVIGPPAVAILNLP